MVAYLKYGRLTSWMTAPLVCVMAIALDFGKKGYSGDLDTNLLQTSIPAQHDIRKHIYPCFLQPCWSPLFRLISLRGDRQRSPLVHAVKVTGMCRWL